MTILTSTYYTRESCAPGSHILEQVSGLADSQSHLRGS